VYISNTSFSLSDLSSVDFRSCDLRVFGGEDETVGVGTGETDALDERVRDRGRALRTEDVRPTDEVRDIDAFTGAAGSASTGGGDGKGIVGGAVRDVDFERTLVEEKRLF
jgi:hypothetical protein